MKIPAYDPSDGPPVLWLTSWAIVLHQRLEGYREPYTLFNKSSRTVSRWIAALKPDALENLRFDQLKVPPKILTKLRKSRLDKLKGEKIRPYYEPFEKTKARFERVDTQPGPVTAFFTYLPDVQDECLTHTRHLAEELDALTNKLLEQQLDGKGGSLEGYKNVLLDLSLVPREYWIVPGRDYDLLPFFEQAADWQTAWKITHLVIFHQQIALLALWDVEYCTEIFGGLRAIPLFLQLAPRFRVRKGGCHSGLRRLNPRQGNIIDNPFGQLIDLVWCLLFHKANGNWPNRFPPDKVMSKSFKKYHGDGEFAQLRAGRPNLTISGFNGLWPDDLQDTCGNAVGPPVTLLAVAHLWNLINPKPIPVDQCYMRAWHQARRATGNDVNQEKMGNIDWPAYLDRGLN
jgi:hypothetical protein